jgi:hypothetical protein
MQGTLRTCVASAAVTTGLLFLWFQVEHRMIWRSAYTDLPGQDTLHLVNGIQPYAMAVVALAAGLTAGLLNPPHRWFAAPLGISPLLLLVAASPHQFWFWCLLGPVLALVGAYAPTSLTLGTTRELR